MLRIGIDIGGTFTDFVVYDPDLQRITTFKLLSDPGNPANTVLKGVSQICINPSTQIIHGSTVATNALLERKGVRTGLVATYGFKDVIQIGRQNRPDLYEWVIKPIPALVPAELRTEVHERVDHTGTVETPLLSVEVNEICSYFESMAVESVAICLLFSFLYPGHEKMIADKLRSLGFFVSASSEILPEFREYERSSTTVVNAYVSPILDRYLSALNESFQDSNLQIMQSNGGMISLNQAKNNGARCILSGPAGGIIGAQSIGQLICNEHVDKELSGPVRLITFDMGGTSTDVSLINGSPTYTTETVIGGYPIHLPLLDIHTIGAGGGSIAYVDAGGSLRVGPQSAGASPGPACYGLGELPTVTDANLVLGRLIPDYFLGGEMPIYPDRAYSSLAKLGSSLNLNAVEAASGVIEVVNAQMERALRVISIERGYDPIDFSLLSFGGAGGLHAIALARQMRIPRVIIPKYASTLSAYGMLVSDVSKDYVRTVMLPGSTLYDNIESLFTPLVEEGRSDLRGEGIENAKIEIHRNIDARYAGQSYELNVPFTDHFLERFRDLHRLNFGYTYEDKEIEIVNLRVRAVGKVPPIALPKISEYDKHTLPKPIQFETIDLNYDNRTIPVYKYDDLLPDMTVNGPALIVSADTTILINDKDTVQVDPYLNLIIRIARPE